MINPKNVQILSQKKYTSHSSQIIEYDIGIPSQSSSWDAVIGIDPGSKNMGLTLLSCIHLLPIHCFEITFPSQRMVISRAVQVRIALADIVGYKLSGRLLIAVEGSAFSSRFQRTELAEARIVAAEWFMDTFNLKEDNFIFIPPATVRKAVFGSAKIKAETQWPQLKGDAASSLAVALAGLALKTV